MYSNIYLFNLVKNMHQQVHTFYYSFRPFPFSKISPDFFQDNTFYFFIVFMVIPKQIIK